MPTRLQTRRYPRPLFRALLLLSLSTFLPGLALAEDTQPTKSNALPMATYQCDFSRGAWNPDDWQMIGRVSAPAPGKWVQSEDHLTNALPEGMTLAQALEKDAERLFVSMVLKKRVSGPARISSVMSFEPRMAPLIVIAQDMEESKPGEFVSANFLEVVIYDKGINLWQCRPDNGKLVSERVAWAAFDLRPNTKYELIVKTDGRDFEATIDGHTIGYRSPNPAQPFYAGITACEGLNHFYNFAVTPLAGRVNR